MDLALVAMLAGDICEALCSYSYIPLQRFLSLFLSKISICTLPYHLSINTTHLLLLTPSALFSPKLFCLSLWMTLLR